MTVDWEKLRRTSTSGERPENWPEDVQAISIDGLALFGIHRKDNKLYWDGNEIVTRSVIRLGTLELWLAAIATASTFGMFVLAIGKAAYWWN